jgi:hypothetical protein
MRQNRTKTKGSMTTARVRTLRLRGGRSEDKQSGTKAGMSAETKAKAGAEGATPEVGAVNSAAG